ncbi:hypothetical protein LIER_14077 [Lithospermum erythrorhizon]|uniref:MULE transposase domain-containing protein n=1 Tax=Lithospermum erythrorhizon TaxID=34254 RepID=A0AAV3PY73_LITER
MRMIKSTWLAKVLQDSFRLLPDMFISVLRLAIDKKYGLLITDNQARRTKEVVLKAIQVALDPNNGRWPLCWTIVEKENKKTWKWFVQALIEYIGIVDEEDYVIISDRRKV